MHESGAGALAGPAWGSPQSVEPPQDKPDPTFVVNVTDKNNCTYVTVVTLTQLNYLIAAPGNPLNEVMEAHPFVMDDF